MSIYRIITKKNKRLSQQPALGALTFLRSFVAGKANFCSHLLASLVHFTVVKSQAILIIRLGVAEVIYHSSWGRTSYFRRNLISSASFKTTKFLPRWICSGTTILRVDSAYRSSRALTRDRGATLRLGGQKFALPLVTQYWEGGGEGHKTLFLNNSL